MNGDTVSLIDASFAGQVAIKVGSQPMDMAFRGDDLFVACQGDGSIHVVDLAAGKVRRVLKAGIGCESLGFFKCQTRATDAAALNSYTSHG